MNENIDKLLREKINRHESAHSSAIWDNVDAAINPIKQKRRCFNFEF